MIGPAHKLSLLDKGAYITQIDICFAMVMSIEHLIDGFDFEERELI